MVDVAVVGAGFMGNNHARAITEHDGLSLAYVVDIDEPRAERVATRYGARGRTEYQAVITDVDAVVIATPPPVHFEQAMTVLKAERHLLLEKPIAMTMTEGRTLASKAKATDAVTGTGFLLRHNPEYARVRELVTNGNLGDIVATRAKRAIATERDGNEAAKLHGHPLMYMNIHDIDAFHFCLDRDVVSVKANERRGELDHMDIPDAVQALLTFEDGSIGVLEGYGVLPGTYPDEISASFEVTGATGTASIEFPGNALSTHTDHFERTDTRLWPIVNGRMGGAVRAQTNQFADAVVNNGDPAASINDGFRALAVVDAIERAIDADGSVKVEY